jgi:hypothetical protein
VAERILRPTSVSAQELWDHFWPRQEGERIAVVATSKLLQAAKMSTHYPVLPSQTALWHALQEGTRENRWVLYLRGPNLAIGAREMHEWPGSPRFEDSVEAWTYQEALDRGVYPRSTGGAIVQLTAQALRDRCWPQASAQLETEAMERFARAIWNDLSRPHLEVLLLDGLRQNLWGVLRRTEGETFFLSEDVPPSSVQVGPAWMLVDPTSSLARQLDVLRPGRGPQTVVTSGTPREAFSLAWEQLGAHQGLNISELAMTVADRDTLDNTILATWVDRPSGAIAHASVRAVGQREVDGKRETIDVKFEGRFEETRGVLSPVWPFARQGGLDLTVTVRFSFNPPLPLNDLNMETYRTAIMNANQGTLELKVVPSRGVAAGRP